MKNYDILNELVPKTQELHRAIFDKGYEQGQKDILEQLHYDNCVSRQAVLNTLDKMDKALDTDRTVENYKELLTECYKDLPLIMPTKKEKIGKWIYKDLKGQFCSACDKPSFWKFDYCPNCGAKMEDKE